ncbi:MAG: GxxExxY protein [Pirellulaceae bacterium]
MQPNKTPSGTEFLYEQETFAIRGACFEFYKEMGPGFLESVYQECLAREFARQNIPFVAQQQLSLQYKGELLTQTFVPDFFCNDKIVIEIKGTREFAPEHKAQLLNYLKATRMRLGLLVNFGHYPKVQIERMAKSF